MNVAGPIRTRPTSAPLGGGGRGGGVTNSKRRSFADGKVGGGTDGSIDVNTCTSTRRPPSFELSLDEFEEYALARLKVRMC